jgi:hypothetical protein
MATPTTLPASFVSGNVLEAEQLNELRGAFRVLQTVSTTLTTGVSVGGSAWGDVTGLAATITPSETSSKILIIASVNGGTFAQFKITGGNSASYRGTGGDQAASATIAGNDDYVANAVMLYLDSPATTSATTYQVQAKDKANATVYINRSQNSATAYTASTITVMEISA